MNNLFLMTTLSITCLLVMQNVQSQTDPNAQTHWKVDGNTCDYNKFIGTVNQTPLVFKTNNQIRLNITPTGELGIGTTTPQAKLDVNGSVKFTNGTINFTSLIDSAITDDGIVLIDSLGYLKRGGSLKDIVYEEPINPFECLDKNGNPKQFPNPTWSNGLNKIYVRCPQVFIGIGTANPRVNLDVRGTSFSDKIAIGSADPTNMGAYLHIKTNPNIVSATQIPLLVENTTTKLMQLNNFGIMQLKTTFTDASNSSTVFSVENPYRKLLQLNNQGVLKTREVIVNLEAWPDYVFGSKYKLLSLHEVDEYIQKEGHLPNIPTQENIIENGVNLGDMNKVLVEKIEELTLYLIQQQKTIDQQQKKIDEIEKLILKK